MKQSFKYQRILPLMAGVLGGVLCVVTFVQASTTISTLINTGGSLTVGGVSTLTGGVTVGANGTTIAQISKGTCNLYSGTGITTIAASSSVNLDCQAASGASGASSALTGVQSGDTVFIQKPTTFPVPVYTGLQIVGANASSTNGYIQVTLYNGTGATYTITSAATSSLQYLTLH